MAIYIGSDASGNGNTWLPVNISTTAGITYDLMVDSPTNIGDKDTGVGGEVRGNYATLNPISNGTAAYVKNGNLRINPSDGNFQPSLSTIGVSSGKWYAECTITNIGSGFMVGIGQLPSTLVATNYLGNTATSWGYYSDAAANSRLYNNSTFTSYGTAYTTGVVIGIALDMDAGTLVFYRNNTSQGTAVTGLSGTYAIGASPAGSAGIADMNFGQRAFAYTAPSGFKALCSQNLTTGSTPLTGAAVQPFKNFDVSVYGGTGVTKTIVNSGFQPDLVWVKDRSSARSHILSDSVRGTSYSLYPNETTVEATNTDRITAFNSNGFNVGTAAGTNNVSESYVGWQWKAGAGTTSNIAVGSVSSGVPSIASTVSANTTAGFSVVGFTMTGSTITVGHGLGVIPAMMFMRSRDDAYNWDIWHKSLTNALTAPNYRLILNDTSGQSVATSWNSTPPTSSVFTVKGDNYGASSKIIAYCFAEVPGYSSFGSYTGNGDSNGPFVYCGFRPRWIMIKRYDASGDPWWIVDSSRSTYNQTTLAVRIQPTATTEDSGANANYDFLANGFKARTASSQNGNETNATYIYAAFAESPFALNNRAR